MYGITFYILGHQVMFHIRFDNLCYTLISGQNFDSRNTFQYFGFIWIVAVVQFYHCFLRLVQVKLLSFLSPPLLSNFDKGLQFLSLVKEITGNGGVEINGSGHIIKHSYLILFI